MKRMLLAVLGAAISVAGAMYVLRASETEAQVETFKPRVQSDREVTMQEIPAAVRETILREAQGHEVSEVEEVTVDGGVFYEADWMQDGREVEVRVSPAGVLLDRGFGNDDDGSDEGADSDDDEGDGNDDDDEREDEDGTSK